MANVAETLTYRFDQEGLASLKRKMSRLTDEVEDMGDEFQQVSRQSDDAFDEIEGDVAALQGAFEAFSTSSMREEIQDIEGTLDALDLDFAEVGVAGLEAGEAIEQGAQNAADAYRELTRDVLAAKAAMGSMDEDIDVDVNRDVGLASGGGGDSVSSGRRGRLPGELGHTVSFFSRLGPAAQASIAGVTALTGALGAAGGLSAAAVVAANKTGVLTDEIEALKARGKGAARDFAEEFSPVLKSDVFPTLRSLIGLVRESDSALAEFTSGTFDALRQLKQLQESGALGRGLIGGPLAAIPGDQPFAPDGFGLSALLSAVPEEGATSEAQGLADRVSNALREVQQSLEKGRKRFSVEGLFGVDRASTLESRISLLEELRTKLIKVRASTDLTKVPEMWPKLDRKIQDIQQSLEEYRQTLQDVQTEKPAAPAVPQVSPESQVISTTASFQGSLELPPVDKAFTRLATRLQNINQMPFLPQTAKARKRTRSVVSAVRRLQQEGKLLSKEALKGFLRELGLSEELIDRVIEKLQRARRVGERMRRKLKRAAADLTVQVGVDIGKSVGAAIMGLSEIQRLKKELSTLQLRQRRQRLRKRISEATSPLQTKALQKQLKLVSARLKKARSEAGAFG